MDAVGFKKSRAEFEDLIYQTIKEPGSHRGPSSMLSTEIQSDLEVRTHLVHKDFGPGSARFTGEAFDIEIQGRGFFTIKPSHGQMVYTRDGSFKRGLMGRMESRHGHPLWPEIVIPQQACGVQIDPNGWVSYISSENETPQKVGQIELVNFMNPVGLKSIGDYLYVPSRQSGPPQQGSPRTGVFGALLQGQLGVGHVGIVNEMTRLRIPTP